MSNPFQPFGGAGGGGGGENNTSSNSGGGDGLALPKVGVDLPFKSITAGANITLTPSATEIEIAATDSGEDNTSSNSGGGEGLALPKVGVDLPFKTLTEGNGITLTPSADEVEIAVVGFGGTKELFLAATDYLNNHGDFRVRVIPANGDFNFSFPVPPDFSALVSAEMIGIINAGAAGAGKNIDLFSDYGAVGEAFNNSSEADTTSTYTIPGTNSIWAFDVSSVLSGIAAGDFVGLHIDHQLIGGTIDYIGLRLRYTPA
jgi:hypothetical protein